MRTVNVNEIIPGTLYQRGQFLTFPWASKIEMLNRYRIDIVVNLWSRPDPELHAKPELIYIHWPIGGASPPAQADIMLGALTEYMKRGYRVLIHCEAGVNRSIWLTAKLVARYQEVNGLVAYEHVISKVGRVKMRSGLLTDLGVE